MADRLRPGQPADAAPARAAAQPDEPQVHARPAYVPNEGAMMRYKVNGTIRIEYSYYAITEDFLPGDEDHCETDAWGVTITLIEDIEEIPEDQRLRALGMPMLPGIA